METTPQTTPQNARAISRTSWLPTDFKKNLDRRIEFLSEAETNPAVQREVYNLARRDIVFFFKYLLWTYNPKIEPNHFPFIPYDFQAELILSYLEEIKIGIGSLTEKSRETGVTYLILGTYLHEFIFGESFEALLLSMKEDEVDNPTPSSMFGKLRYMNDRLPFWMRPIEWDPRRHSKYMTLKNPDNGNSIVGQATTMDAGRSGRKTAVFVDEHASVNARIIQGIETALQETTNTIQRVSTPKGINLFKAIRDRGLCRIHTFHWTRIPGKREDLYYFSPQGERVECPDLPESRISKNGYLVDAAGKVTESKLRSPWYDGKCLSYISAREVAQELDINYLGSGFCRFDASMIEAGSAATRDGIRGYLVNDGDEDDPKPRFIEVDKGAEYELEVWAFPTKPVWENRSFIGVDLAEGLERGDYSSADVILRDPTGVAGTHAAALHGHFSPDVFGYKILLLALWYDDGAELAIERNKDGLGVILDLKNRFKYHRLFKGHDKKDGWLTSASNKFTLTGDLDEALRNGELRTESLNHFTELSTYENNNGKLGSTGINHDDRVMSLAIAQTAARQGGKPREKPIGKPERVSLRRFEARGF